LAADSYKVYTFVKIGYDAGIAAVDRLPLHIKYFGEHTSGGDNLSALSSYSADCVDIHIIDTGIVLLFYIPEIAPRIDLLIFLFASLTLQTKKMQ